MERALQEQGTCIQTLYNNIYTMFQEQKGTIAKISRRRTWGRESAVVSRDQLMNDSVKTGKYFNLS